MAVLTLVLMAVAGPAQAAEGDPVPVGSWASPYPLPVTDLNSSFAASNIGFSSEGNWSRTTPAY